MPADGASLVARQWGRERGRVKLPTGSKSFYPEIIHVTSTHISVAKGVSQPCLTPKRYAILPYARKEWTCLKTHKSKIRFFPAGLLSAFTGLSFTVSPWQRVG